MMFFQRFDKSLYHFFRAGIVLLHCNVDDLEHVLKEDHIVSQHFPHHQIRSQIGPGFLNLGQLQIFLECAQGSFLKNSNSFCNVVDKL